MITVIVLILTIVAGYTGVNTVKTRADVSDYDILCNSIQKAVTECYVLEGMYPPSVEYLEEHYGIQIDRDKYAVFYEGFASNMVPDITVIKLDNSSQGGST